MALVLVRFRGSLVRKIPKRKFPDSAEDKTMILLVSGTSKFGEVSHGRRFKSDPSRNLGSVYCDESEEKRVSRRNNLF